MAFRALTEFHITPAAFLEMDANEQAFVAAAINEFDRQREEAYKGVK